MSDYAKKTVAELNEILKSRGLPHTGKKADLVARLGEADKEADTNAAITAPAARSTAPAPETGPDQTTTAPLAAAPEPTLPSTAPASGPGEQDADSPSANTDTNLAAATSYALNLPTSTVDSELAKRKARAERFGTGTTNGETTASDGSPAADKEALKNLERANRFGTGQAAVGKLDEALTSDLARQSRTRGEAPENSAMDDPGLKQGFRRGGSAGGRYRGRGRGNGPRSSSRSAADAGRPAGVHKAATGAAVFSSDKDRLAADARKKRFTAA